MKISVLMIVVTFPNSLFYACECSCITEKCTRTIFVRKNVKNYIFLDEWVLLIFIAGVVEF